MNTLLRQLFDERTRKHEHTLNNYVQKLNAIWEKRDVLWIVRYMQELEANNIVTVIEEDQPLKAL